MADKVFVRNYTIRKFRLERLVPGPLIQIARDERKDWYLLPLFYDCHRGCWHALGVLAPRNAGDTYQWFWDPEQDFEPDPEWLMWEQWHVLHGNKAANDAEVWWLGLRWDENGNYVGEGGPHLPC